MDMASIAAAISSLKVAGDIAVGLINLKSATDVNTIAVELNQKILAAQHALFEANATQTALVERIRELEGQIAAMKDWDAQKKRYKLVTPYTGVTVYAMQQSMCDGEPPHYICANCFQNNKRSMLAHTTNKEGWVAIVCAVCKFSAQTRYRGLGPPKYAEEITGPE